MSGLGAAFVLLVLAIGLCVLVGVRAIGRRVPGGRPGPSVVVGVALVGWLGLTGVLAHLDLLAFRPTRPPLVLALVWLPILGILAGVRTVRGRALLDGTPAAWLIGLQLFRVPVELVLWRLHAEGLIPARMTFNGRNFDILVGLSAPVVAWLAARGRLPRWGEAAWHLGGLALLVNVATLAFLSAPSPLRRFFDEVPLTLPATLPWIWLPAVLVPVAFGSHVLGLARVWGALRPHLSAEHRA